MTPERLSGQFATLIVFLPFFTGSVFGLGITAWGLWRRMQMRRWPAAPGRVQEARGVQRPARGLFGRKEHVLDLEIEYLYQWDGTTYKAMLTREAELPRSSAPLPDELVQPAVERFRSEICGRNLAVYVNPRRPDQSLLEPVAVKRDAIAVAVFAVLAIVFGALCVSLVPWV